jgi:type I restriction enzyme R subunit
VALAAIEQLPAGGFDRLQLVGDAVNALIAPDTLRREFFAHERYVTTLYNAVKPEPAAVEFTGRISCLAAIAEAIRAKLNPNPADITHVMGQIAELLDVSITGAEIAAEGPPPLDLSRIDFEALSQRFKKSKTKNTDLEVLKAAIRAQLNKLIRINRTRADYLDKFEELIEAYNNGSSSIEELFEELLRMTRLPKMFSSRTRAASRPRASAWPGCLPPAPDTEGSRSSRTPGALVISART